MDENKTTIESKDKKKGLLNRIFSKKKERPSEEQLWQKEVDMELLGIDNTIKSLEEEIKEKSVENPEDVWNRMNKNEMEQKYDNEWKEVEDRVDQLSDKLQKLDKEAKKIVLKKDTEILDYTNKSNEIKPKLDSLKNEEIDSNFYYGEGYKDGYIEKLSKIEDNKLKKLKQLAEKRKQLSDKRKEIENRIKKTNDVIKKKIEEQLNVYNNNIEVISDFWENRKQTGKAVVKNNQQKKKKQQNSRIDSSTSSSLKNMNSETNNIAGSNQKSTFKQIKQQGGEKMESNDYEDYTQEAKKTSEKTKKIKLDSDSSTSLSSDSKTDNILDFKNNQVFYQRKKQEVKFPQSSVSSQEQTNQGSNSKHSSSHIYSDYSSEEQTRNQYKKTPANQQQNLQYSNNYSYSNYSSQTLTERQDNRTPKKELQNLQYSNNYNYSDYSSEEQTNQKSNLQYFSSHSYSDYSLQTLTERQDNRTPKKEQRNRKTLLSNTNDKLIQPKENINLSMQSIESSGKTPKKKQGTKNITKLEKEVKNLREELKSIKNLLIQQIPQNQQAQLQQQIKQKQTPPAAATPIINNNKPLNSAPTTLLSGVPTTKTSQNQQIPRKKPMTWDEVRNDDYGDLIGFIENVIKYVKENFGGDYNKFEKDYNANYSSKYKNDKNKFVEKLGGIDKVTKIAKGDKTPRQLAEETLKFEMVNYLVNREEGIERARKMTENVKFDKQPLKQYAKNLETIYKKKKKIQNKGNIPLTLKKIGEALEKGVKKNSIGLKRRFITKKTKESARGINNLVMGAITEKVKEKHGDNAKFDDLTPEEKSIVLNESLANFNMGEGVTTNSIFASDRRAADLVMQGLKNTKDLVEKIAKDEVVLEKCNNQIKGQTRNARNAINEKSARCASEYCKKEIEGEKEKKEVDYTKVKELQKKFDKFKGEEGKLKKQVSRTAKTVNKNAIRRKNVVKNQLKNNRIVANLNFKEIKEHIESKSDGIEGQFKTNREKQRTHNI